jgi:hypothetical protein
MLLVLPVSNFFVRIFDAFVEARRLQAAFETAQYLKSYNKDFSDWSTSDLVRHILDDTGPDLIKK